MSDQQLLAKHDEHVDAINVQTDAHVNTIRREPDAPPVSKSMANNLAKAALGGVVGALVGTVAGALTNKKTSESINQTLKGVGDAVKGVASGFNKTAKGATDAVKDTVEDVKPSVKNTVEAVKDTVEDVKPSSNQGVKTADNKFFKLYEERLVADKKQVKTASVSFAKHVETQMAHISVPVEKERLIVERTVPVEAGTPVAPGEANFYEGEIARMEVYEETADVHKQAFVREEVNVRKEVEHDTVEVEDKIRREELDVEIQNPNDIDKTKTL